MTRAIGVSTSQIDYPCEGGVIDKILVTTMVYEDGRIVQQYGEGVDWTQIKDPDKWESVPDEGGLEIDEDAITEKGKCGVCNQMFKRGELTIFNATSVKVHRYSKHCGQ